MPRKVIAIIGQIKSASNWWTAGYVVEKWKKNGLKMVSKLHEKNRPSNLVLIRHPEKT